MPAVVTNAWQRFAAFLRGFTAAQRAIALIGVAAVVLGAVALGTWLSRPSYSPLFSGLSAADASAVVDQLQADGVAYELADGGSTVLVPRDSVYEERLALASAGLPSETTPGYSLLDQMGVTASEFQQDVTYQRALEGELAATISAMSGIQTASVRLALPTETVFTESVTAPTASVFVQTSGTSTLTSDQVAAITHLVSASIEGMAATDVAVIDAEGTVLSTVGEGIAGGAGQQAADYEQRVQSSVLAMLERIVGAGNASVVVTAELDNATTERTSETYAEPENAPALSESVDTETYTGGAGGAEAGVLGPDNIAVPNGAADGDGGYTSESTTRSNAVDRTVESVVVGAGGLARQNVSVALDAAAMEGVDVAGVEELVATAAGVNADRGDAVSVRVVDFDTAGAEAAQEALEEAQRLEENERTWSLISTIAMIGAVLIATLVSALVIARLARRQRREPVDIGELQERHGEIAADGGLQSLLEPDPPTVPIESLEPIEPIVPASSELKRAEVAAAAERDPARAAEVLRSMLAEGQR